MNINNKKEKKENQFTKALSIAAEYTAINLLIGALLIISLVLIFSGGIENYSKGNSIKYWAGGAISAASAVLFCIRYFKEIKNDMVLIYLGFSFILGMSIILK